MSTTIALGLVACERELRNPPAMFDHQDVPTTALHGEVLSNVSELGLPSDIIAVGSYLVVADQAGEPFVHLFGSSDGELVASFGRKGEGPGEFRAAPKFLKVPNATESRFAVLDVGLGRITEFDLSDPPASLDEPTIIPLKTDWLAYELHLLPGNRAVGLGLFEEGRIAFIDLESGAVEFVGTAPQPRQGEEAVPPGFLQYAYQANLAVSPDGSEIAAALRRGSTIELFDAEGVTQREGPYEFAVDFVVDGGEGNPTHRAGEMNRYGYVDFDGTTKRIWGLFSGRSEEAYRNDSWLAEYIHVFTWSGDFTQAFHIDRPLVAIEIVEDTIFGVTTDPEPALVRIVLPATTGNP